MKRLIKIQFTTTLVAALSMGGLAKGQISEVSGEEDGGQSRGVAQALPDAPSDAAPLPPAAAAFVYYFEIQEALAQDSLTNVAVNAVALAEALRKDSTGGFPAQLADQARALARDAVTLTGARLDFSIVTGQLMNYLKARNPPVGLGPIHLVHDPITRLYWLQRGDLVQNPYLGKSGVPWKPLIPPALPQPPLKISGF
ncbi:MAG TPA: hypothetical protein VNI81_03970 [Candidatus Limnocylindrales bacterium]|nr:hypothetical protein [Candidatus Limnocylindrales bacterium]